MNGATVYLKDVATVRDGFAVQTNIVRTNGTRGALLTILRNGQASTLDIVNKVKAALPRIEAAMPPGVESAATLRSVAVRARIHQRRGAGSRDRRAAHRLDDPAVSGKLAQHGDRLHLDSAVHS